LGQRLFEIKITGGFASAHNLKDFRGKCENLHGHNWKVEAVLQNNSSSENIARFLFERFSAKINAEKSRLYGVYAWESPDASAAYMEF